MNDENILIDGGIDYYHSIERFAGNIELYHKFLFRFPNEEAYRKLQNDMNAEDFTAAERSSHSLKGISGNLGIKSIYEISVELLAALRGQDIDKAKEIYASLTVEFDRISAVIKNYTDS